MDWLVTKATKVLYIAPDQKILSYSEENAYVIYQKFGVNDSTAVQ
jgi:hypothetical protein